ncbi:Bax inhibitor-1/YccA family protein [Oceanobacillus jeddahense]|uniref:Bax inhibitor-1/YccA family protein n=1 Tax=Oceanobacillus jeddahense TaxID=1462527 RepID=A0ABY5K0M7_9BACI|nr:Bax inhibitor-1/YccA family protein [Oceanobacillus jeddahense]UUI04329.1 Bax inhibitor-1/YccA family protein [Oceanobacillus jeddahense]
MTVSGTLWRTLILFVILHLGALVGIFSTVAPVFDTGLPQDVTVIPWVTALICGGMAGTVLAIKKNVDVPLIITFTWSEGWFLGGFAAYFEGIYPGIILQAAFTVLSTVVAFLPLFAIKSVRAIHSKIQILLVILGGCFVFILHNLTLMGFDFLPAHIPWGKGAPTVVYVPIGLMIAFLVILMSAYVLVITYKRIENDVYRGFPRKHAWNNAFKVMITIIWYYVEAPKAIANTVMNKRNLFDWKPKKSQKL